jgi:flagellar protein FliS
MNPGARFMPSVANPYLETQVMTASAERLHQMVVDAAIRFARQAEQALDQADYEGAFHALRRSRDCVNEILVGITTDPDPEFAERLRALFVFIYQNLMHADLTRNAELVRDALAILETHRDTWLQLIESIQKGKPDQSVAEPERFPGSRSWST